VSFEARPVSSDRGGLDLQPRDRFFAKDTHGLLSTKPAPSPDARHFAQRHASAKSYPFAYSRADQMGSSHFPNSDRGHGPAVENGQGTEIPGAINTRLQGMREPSKAEYEEQRQASRGG